MRGLYSKKPLDAAADRLYSALKNTYLVDMAAVAGFGSSRNPVIIQRHGA
jgi:hypothetical protein